MRSNTSATHYKPLALFLACLLLLMASIPSLAGSVGNLLTDVKLTGFSLKTVSGNPLPATGVTVGSRVRLDIEWDASAYGYNIQEDQYFEINLPDNMTFPTTPENLDFPLYHDGASDPFAHAKITPTPGGGGTLRVTFTSYVQDNQWTEVKGTLFFMAYVEKTKVDEGEENTFTVDIAGEYTHSVTVVVNPQKPENVSGETFRKWAGDHVERDKASWAIRINVGEQYLTGVKVEDSFERGDTESPIFIYPEFFTLQKVLYHHDGDGNILHHLGFEYAGPREAITPAPDSRLEMKPGNAGFTFFLGETEEALPDFPGRYYTYILRYVSSYEQGKVIKNKATGTHTEAPAGIPFPSSYRYYESGGDGTGTSASYTARKLWVNQPESGRVTPTLLLKQDGTLMAQQPTPTITAYDDFLLYRWAQLPVTNPVTNELYKYSVEEEGVEDGLVRLGAHLYRVEQDGGDITNIYVTPASIAPSIRKEYDGPALPDGEVFTFQLLSWEGATVLDTKTLSAAGEVTFKARYFENPGTYIFHIREVKGNATGITYDSSQYTLYYTVAVNEETNALEVATRVLKNDKPFTGPMVFTNTYEAPKPEPKPDPKPDPKPPTPTYPTLRVPLSVQKVLKNGTLKAGAFTFELRDGNGKFIAQATNAADGTVTFPDRTFSKVVTNYLYTIREIEGADSKMIYDNTVYTVKVSTKAVNGQLQATINVEKNGTPFAGPMVFTNQRKLPPTGDSMYTIMALLAAGSLMMMGGAYALSRKRSRHDAA